MSSVHRESGHFFDLPAIPKPVGRSSPGFETLPICKNSGSFRYLQPAFSPWVARSLRQAGLASLGRNLRISSSCGRIPCLAFGRLVQNQVFCVRQTMDRRFRWSVNRPGGHQNSRRFLESFELLSHIHTTSNACDVQRGFKVSAA